MKNKGEVETMNSIARVSPFQIVPESHFFQSIGPIFGPRTVICMKILRVVDP